MDGTEIDLAMEVKLGLKIEQSIAVANCLVTREALQGSGHGDYY